MEITAPWRREQQKEQARKDAAEKKRVAQEVNQNLAHIPYSGSSFPPANNGTGLVQGHNLGAVNQTDMMARGLSYTGPSTLTGGPPKSPLKTNPPIGLFSPTPPKLSRSPFEASPTKKPPSFG